MALKTILNQQTDFTGEFPVEWAKDGLWRMNESAPDENNNLLDSSGAGRPACVVGQCSVETLGNIFLPTSRQASCNYGIGVDGRVGMYVEEKNRSWCSSSSANDQRAITIECASDTTEPYALSDILS